MNTLGSMFHEFDSFRGALFAWGTLSLCLLAAECHAGNSSLGNHFFFIRAANLCQNSLSSAESSDPEDIAILRSETAPHSDKARAEARIILRHQGLILDMVRKASRRRFQGADIEDGIAIATEHLLRASKAFDPHVGTPFYAFAKVYLKNALSAWRSRLIPLLERSTPERKTPDYIRYIKAASKVLSFRGRAPSEAELVALTGIRKARIRHYMEQSLRGSALCKSGDFCDSIEEHAQPTSVTDPLGQYQRFPDPFDAYDKVETNEILSRLFSKFSSDSSSPLTRNLRQALVEAGYLDQTDPLRAPEPVEEGLFSKISKDFGTSHNWPYLQNLALLDLMLERIEEWNGEVPKDRPIYRNKRQSARNEKNKSESQMLSNAELVSHFFAYLFEEDQTLFKTYFNSKQLKFTHPAKSHADYGPVSDLESRLLVFLQSYGARSLALPTP